MKRQRSGLASFMLCCILLAGCTRGAAPQGNASNSPEEQVQLVLEANSSLADTELLREFTAETGIEILQTSSYQDIEPLLTDLMAGQGPDIFLMDTQTALEYGIAESGRLLPLTGEPVYALYTDAFGWLEQLGHTEGGYWMLPLDIDGTKLYYSPELLSGYGFTPQIFESYDTIFSAASDLLAQSGVEEPLVAFGGWLWPLYSYVWQYFALAEQGVYSDYDTPAMRTALQNMLLVGEMMLEFEQYQITATSIWQELYPGLAFEMNFDMLYLPLLVQKDEVVSGLRARPLPRLDTNMPEANPVRLNCLFVNSGTAYPQQAQAFIDFMAEKVHGSGSSFMFEDVGLYTAFDTSLPLFEDLYNFYKNGVVFNFPGDLYVYLLEYFRGETTQEETIFAIVRYMEMLAQEAA